MIRSVKIARLVPASIVTLFGENNKYDKAVVKTGMPENETGKDRVKKMFSRDEFGQSSVELYSVYQATFTGLTGGAVMGGIVHSRDAYLYFLETNQATIFKCNADAKKKLQDFVTTAFGKGAYRWGWRLGIFTGIFSLVSTTISVYRDDTSIIEYIVAGATAGACYRINLGPAAMLVSGLLGAGLSAIAGGAIILLLKVTGITVDDIRKTYHKFKKHRENQMDQVMEKSATIKNDEITKHHDILISEKGEKKLDEL